MAEVTKFAVPVAQTPHYSAFKVTPFRYDIAVVSGDCPQNDYISIFTPPSGAIITGAVLSHSATLGASATAKLRLSTTALSGASTAGGASTIIQTVANAPALADGTVTLNVLIEGAAITASATITVAGFYLTRF